MDLRRLRFEEWLVGLSGVLLLVALFLPWHRYAQLGVTHSGWEAFGGLDVVLTVVACAAIGLALMTAIHPTAAVPIALTSLLGLVGLVATVWLVIEVASPPSGASTEAGAWLGLAGCLGATIGALIGMRDERYPRAVAEGAHIEIETRPAPPREGGAEGSA